MQEMRPIATNVPVAWLSVCQSFYLLCVFLTVSLCKHSRTGSDCGGDSVSVASQCYFLLKIFVTFENYYSDFKLHVASAGG